MCAANLTSDGAPARRPKNWGPADVLTALRIPLAIAFVVVPDTTARLVILAAAGLSDVLDGIVARRCGPSRIGAVLDPVVDKVFMLAAVLTVVSTRAGIGLRWWEISGVLLRDLAVFGGFIATLFMHRNVTIPARSSGKVVSVLQFATVAAVLLERHEMRPLAWVTAAVSIWAIVDYAVAGVRIVRSGTPLVAPSVAPPEPDVRTSSS
ncbi:MAG: CDP-alcohol phosphatidyltransferase family protein [Planctomycetes bacterium]|nr:CDP-alcohol phosphatidyltransferase family protein [Planctomycetota bacterium]